MDVRKTLVELLGAVSCQGPGESLGSCPNRRYGQCGEVENLSYCVAQNTANHLIAHGVTVQEWISVKDKLPEESGEYLAYCGEYDGICVLYFEILKTKSKWITNWKEVTHWMHLPQPPKGE